MEQVQLNEVLRLHVLYLNSDSAGTRANLCDANLCDANLCGANLRDANLRKTILDEKTVLLFQFGKHFAYFYGSDEIIIGCHKHPVSYWLESFENIGKNEGYSADQIEKYGNFIKYCASIFNGSK